MVLEFFGGFIGDMDVLFDIGCVCRHIFFQLKNISLKSMLYSEEFSDFLTFILSNFKSGDTLCVKGGPYFYRP